MWEWIKNVGVVLSRYKVLLPWPGQRRQCQRGRWAGGGERGSSIAHHRRALVLAMVLCYCTIMMIAAGPPPTGIITGSGDLGVVHVVS